MPGVLVDDSLANPSLALPTSSPSLLSPLQHYIPVLTRSIMPDFCDDELPPSQLSPLRRPAGVRLNVNSLPDMYADDGNLLEPGLLLQLSPASAVQWGCNGASPTTLSALSGLRQFLPSNFEEDEGGIESQTDMYSCDEFRMYEFKVRRCMRGRSHDWTECPFAHPGEKARRRDPRRFHYSGTACADFRKGACKKGDVCEYAHGVFECWLHPARYRTQPCKDGRGCRRRICFFAHTLDQLRVTSPMAASPSALSSPTSLHFSPTEAEAFELCGSSSPIRSPAKKASYESFTPPLASSPLCHMAMEASSDGFFSLIPPVTPSPPVSPSVSSRSAHINWSPRGVSTFALPNPAMPHLYSSLHLNRTQASPSPMPAHYRHLERLNQSLIPQLQGESKSALPSPTSATSTMQRVQDLMGLLKQAELTKEEHDWRAIGGQPVSYCDGNAMLWKGVRSVPEAPMKMGYSRAREEEMLIGDYCNDEEGEPKLERVESGKGLRAQIFESLLRSASQPSDCTYQDSNSEPPRSASSLGMF